MPKQLVKPQPTSSVARLLDVEAAARAVAANPPRPADSGVPPLALLLSSAAPAQKAADNRPRIKRELVLTEKADVMLSQLVELYRRHTGTKLTTSHVARAVLKGIAHCIETIEREARRLGPLQLPANSAECELDREKFEARIADAFVAGVRNAASFDLGADHETAR